MDQVSSGGVIIVWFVYVAVREAAFCIVFMKFSVLFSGTRCRITCQTVWELESWAFISANRVWPGEEFDPWFLCLCQIWPLHWYLYQPKMTSFISAYYRNFSKINSLEVHVYYYFREGLLLTQIYVCCKPVSFPGSWCSFVGLCGLSIYPVFHLCACKEFPSLPFNLIQLFCIGLNSVSCMSPLRKEKWKHQVMFLWFTLIFTKFLAKANVILYSCIQIIFCHC